MGLCFSDMPRLLQAEDGTHPSGLPAPHPSPHSAAAPFRPSIAVIVGVLTTLFSLTFLLLLYAKHCKRQTGQYAGGTGVGFSATAEPRNSGVGRAVVESLPAFRFGSLRGQKDGLECAVCLNRFEQAEVLRLLPKCKHAFHVECVDVWLDAHSTCPLCRVRVDPEDILFVHDPKPEHDPPATETKAIASKGGDGTANPFPLGRRFSGRHSSAGEKSSSSLQIVVHRVDSAETGEGRARRSVDHPVKGRIRKDGLLATEMADREEFERRFSHRIVVSDGDGTQDRWSDLRPSDLLFLRSEMIITDSGRFSATRVWRAAGYSPAGGRGVITSRSVSEITGVSRLPSRGEEERTRRKWLGFAAWRTARWLRSKESGNGPS